MAIILILEVAVSIYGFTKGDQVIHVFCDLYHIIQMVLINI